MDTCVKTDVWTEFLTPSEGVPGSDTMTWALWSHIILQKSFMVPGKGFWVMMNSFLCLYPYKNKAID